MSLSPDTLDAVKALIANDDALLKRLSQVTTSDEAARIVTEAASAKACRSTPRRSRRTFAPS